MRAKKLVIVSGGDIGDWALPEIIGSEIRVGADRGALFLIEQGFIPDMALGDFDSVTAEQVLSIKRNSREFLSCDALDKDLTDTEMALEWALTQQPLEIVMLAVLGTRWDHSLANIHLLSKTLEAHIPCRIMDSANVLQLVEGSSTTHLERSNQYPYVSLLPFTTNVSGVTLEGFRYPLHHASLRIGQSLGVSNRIDGDIGIVTIEEGRLLIIRSKD